MGQRGNKGAKRAIARSRETLMSQTAQASFFSAKQPSAQGPWPLPSGWEWMRLGHLLKLEYGKALPAKDRDSGGSYSVFGSGGQVGEHSSAITNAPAIIVGRKGSIGALFFSKTPCWPIDTTYYIDLFPFYIDPKYIYFFLKTLGLERLNKSAAIPGLNRDDVHALSVPVPFVKDWPRSLDIQRRIVARIEALLAEVKEARALATAIRRDTDRLLAAAVHEVFTSLHSVANIVPLEKVATAFNGRASGEGNSTVRVFKTKHVYPHCLRLDRSSFMKAEQVQEQPRNRYLKPGDVLMANIAEGTLGRVSYVHKCEESWTVDTQIMILRSLDDRNLLLGKWLYYYLWSERGQQEILARRSGIAFADKRGQTHIYPKNVLEIPVPVPPIKKQIQAVALLDNVQTEAEEMRRLQTQDAELLDQLEQSILERAFRGEL